MIHLYGSLYIADPWPAAYIKDLNALVIADLHLGIEGVLANEGIFLPTKASHKTIEIVCKSIENYNVNKIILVGDVKHGFGLLNTTEWLMVKKFIRDLKEKYNLDIVVIRGNHDNYLGVVLDKFNIPFYLRWDLKDYTFIHGHVDYELNELNKIIIMGHEHPSIILHDDLGVRYKFKCFLWGEYRDRRILVLPSVNELATGSAISANLSRDLILSPILKKVDLNSFKPYPIIPGEIVRELPTLRDIAKIFSI